GDERNPAFIGERDEGRLDFAFGATPMALQLDIKSVAEQPLERFATALRQVTLAGGDRHIERPAGPAGQRDQPFSLPGAPGKPQLRRLLRRGREEDAGGSPHEAALT